MVPLPRVFHRIWLGGRPLPRESAAFGRSWERLHPGWEMRLWTEKNLFPLFNSWAFEHAPTLSGKADVLRYEILFRFGGVYIDTDFECRRSLEPLLEGVRCFAGRYGDGKFEHGRFASINNAILGSVPGHPYLRDLVEEVEANLRSLSADTPISAILTGPVFATYVLQRHPEVTVFPARYFYPYGARERWRRHERFPGAYAVHHWSLDGLSVLRPDRGRRMGWGRRPCLSVALQPKRPCDAVRLRWVLEGLCAQSVSDFEVIAPIGLAAGALGAELRRMRGRLRLRTIGPGEGESDGPRPAGWRNRAVRHARADRILFLDSDCLPDADVVARHAVHGSRPVLVYGYRRIYPRSKLFPFRHPIDYGGIYDASRREEVVFIAPSASRWRDVKAFCFSAPVAAVRAVGGFRERAAGGEVRDLARRLSIARCPTQPCLYGSTTTWLGPPDRMLTRRGGGRRRLWEDKLE